MTSADARLIRTQARCGHCGRRKMIAAYLCNQPVCGECSPGLTLLYKMLELGRVSEMERVAVMMQQMGHV